MRILAIDIGGTAIKVGVFNNNGELLQRDEYPTEAYKGGYSVMKHIFDIISEHKDVDRIGISSAGQINDKSGQVIYATENIPNWTGMEIKKIIHEKFNKPVSVENDVNAAALGEAYYGSAIGEKNFICVTYGTGIGGAIIRDGEVFRGAFGSAGEFGHIITHTEGRRCTCGGKGCYEAYASTLALVKAAKKILGVKNLNGKDIFRYVKENNSKIISVVNCWITEVMAGLISIIYIFNPSTIVLGGGIMSEEYILGYIQKHIRNLIMPNYRCVSILRAALGNDAGLLGAMYSAGRMANVK